MKTSHYKKNGACLDNGACPIAKQYKTIQNYLDDTLDFLLENPVKNNIIIGQCLNTKDKEKQVENTILINLFDGEKLVLSLFKNLKKALIVGKDYSSKELQKVSAYLTENKIEVSGIIAEKSLALSFSKAHFSAFKIEKTLIALQLEKLKTIQLSEGEFEICTSKDLDLVTEWISRFQIECALDNQRNQEDLRKDMAHYIEQKKFFKWIDNSQIVSIAAINAETDYYSKISLVYTPTEFRRKNYARSCVWSLTKLILKTQPTVCLFTDKSNPTSNKIYGEIGFEAVNEDYMIEL
jgi:uncharacterized protein